jgi:hypothetical protein
LAPVRNPLLDPNAYKGDYSVVQTEKSSQNRKSCVLSALFLAIALVGCATPQVIKEAVYIDKPCDRASDYAPVVWHPVRWISVIINGAGYVATPDGEALLGNLLRLRESKPSDDLNLSDADPIGASDRTLSMGPPSDITGSSTSAASGTTHAHKIKFASFQATQRSSNITYTNGLSVPLFLLAQHGGAGYPSNANGHKGIRIIINDTTFELLLPANTSSTGLTSAIIPPNATYQVVIHSGGGNWGYTLNTIYTYPLM